MLMFCQKVEINQLFKAFCIETLAFALKMLTLQPKVDKTTDTMNALETVERLKQRFPNEPEYIQAVSQVLGTIEEEYNRHPEFDRANLIERLCIPDRIISFRVTWVDDKGNVQTNMGYRVQHNNAIGGWHSFPRFGQSVYLEVSCFRADIQKFAHHAANGWCKGWFRLLTARQEQCRGNAFLPGVYERTVPPYWC